MLSIIIDTIVDLLKIFPFLFFAFVLVEFLEHKMNERTQKWIQKAGAYGPIIGSSLGVIPQCGFSIAATNLYVTRIISLGTLIAIYLSTSDEMLPVFLSKGAPISLLLQILFLKWIIGMGIGILIDFFLRKRKRGEEGLQYELCQHDHCDCKHESIFVSSWKHTINTCFFLFIFTFIINVLFTYYGEDFFSHLFLKGSIFSPFLASFIGLIPSCGASILLTELYLQGLITFPSCIAGLLTGSGSAFLVLCKSNKNKKENLFILFSVYIIGAFIGFLLECLFPLF